jgi:hypothetical protein
MNLELSCYTTNLVAFLDNADLAHAIRLAVRTDLPNGELAFSHHTRVDRDRAGRRLAYRGAPTWEQTRRALQAEVTRHGRVLAVGNTRHLPWSPLFGRRETPHWLLVSRTPTAWLVTDHFAALTPHGEQKPCARHCHDAELRDLLTPPTALAPEAVNRDRYALGEEVELPPYTGYRWLEWADDADPPELGTWIHGVVPVLRHVAVKVCEDTAALERCADDLWTAARHQRHRLSTLDEPRNAEAAAWAELPKTIRFALESAARGRPRPTMVATAFRRVISVVEAS